MKPPDPPSIRWGSEHSATRFTSPLEASQIQTRFRPDSQIFSPSKYSRIFFSSSVSPSGAAARVAWK